MTRLLLALPLAVLVQACGPDIYLVTEEHDRVPGGTWVYTGGGCVGVDSGSSTGMGGGALAGPSGTGNSFSISTGEDGVMVQVIEAGEVTIDRHYDFEFLESGKKERVTFPFGDTLHRITLWGSPDYVEPRTPDEREIERALADGDAGAVSDGER
jgi:hypothetical protein